QPPDRRRQHQPQKRSSNPYREAMPPSFDGPADNSQNEEWESNFSKRYPALAGLEMVETEINGQGHGEIGSPPSAQQVRVKDV
ncbi:MAG: hypothetical protein Q9226_008347, partial [Calogaya cf. arnoldii]